MKKVLIIGCGFAGSSAAKKLARFKNEFEVTVIDRKKTFDFLPALPDVIGRGMKPVFLSFPIADLAKKAGFNFINSEVKSLDLQNSFVTAGEEKINYDYLLISAGSETNFYNNESVRKYAYKLDDTQDAVRIRRALDENKYDNFIISGAGYTGVEIASNLRVYLNKKSRQNKIIMLERASSILGPLPDWMKTYVLSNLKELGVEILTDTVIEKINSDEIAISGGKTFKKSMLIWVSGVKIADFAASLNVEKTAQGRLKVDKYLRLSDNCFVAGDASSFTDNSGRQLRMAVQFAIYQSLCAAQNIINSGRKHDLIEYRPVDLGYVIPMANNKSCGNIFGFDIKGFLPTILHYSMCVYRAHGLRNKIGIIAG